MAGQGFHLHLPKKATSSEVRWGKASTLAINLLAHIRGRTTAARGTGGRAKCYVDFEIAAWARNSSNGAPDNQAEYRTSRTQPPALVFYPDGQVETRLRMFNSAAYIVTRGSGMNIELSRDERNRLVKLRSEALLNMKRRWHW